MNTWQTLLQNTLTPYLKALCGQRGDRVILDLFPNDKGSFQGGLWSVYDFEGEAIYNDSTLGRSAHDVMTLKAQQDSVEQDINTFLEWFQAPLKEKPNALRFVFFKNFPAYTCMMESESNTFNLRRPFTTAFNVKQAQEELAGRLLP